MQKKKIIRSIISVLFIFLIGILNFNICSADEIPDVRVRNGSIRFYTNDTTATNDTTWGTVGFTVTRKKCRTSEIGGDPWKLPHATFKLTKDMMHSTSGGGNTKVYFEIPEEVVSKALVKAGFQEIKKGDKLYLHTIFQVYVGGKKSGPQLHTYNGIKYAKTWGNPNDFNDRFDIPVTYEPDAAGQKVKVKYMYSTGEVFKTETLDNVAPGEKVRYTFAPEKKEKDGKTWYLSKSYMVNLAVNKRIVGTTNFVTSLSKKYYPEQVKPVRTREKTQILGGMEIVGVYRPIGEKPPNKNEEIIDLEPEAPFPYGTIAAEERDSEEFDVTEGIPTTEKLYANVLSSKYIMGYTFTRVYGTKTYNVEGTKTYHLSWSEKDPKTGKSESKSDTRTVSKIVKITRDYSYWKITNLEYYKIGQADLKNYALPGSTLTLKPVGYTVPDLTYWHSAYMADHIVEPDIGTVNLGSESVSGSSTPMESFTEPVNARINQIKVRNDSMVFDGQTVMKNEYKQTKTAEPVEPELDYDEIGQDVLYKTSLTIDKDKTNGTYPSEGTVTYVPVKTMASRITNPVYEVGELTDVVIHTPTICDGYISNQEPYNQMLHPDQSLASLVLDTKFSVLLATEGEHRDIDGYGYRDYAKYIDRRQVKFPFDIYQGSVYYSSGSWITLTSDTTEFYLPIWVDEGKYTIDFRSITINADANNGIGKTETLANLDVSNYVATDTLDVEVSGRVYDLQLYDISDYPIWETVFRKPNSLKLSGFNYSVGTKNRNGEDTGRKNQYTLTPVNGSHPGYKTVGAIKTGYVTRFRLTTIGNMYSNQDAIWIKPTFYYVDAKGNNRQEVDLYYSETIQGKKQNLVKVGSNTDWENVKAYRLGDPYLTVPETELQTKAAITGKTLNQVKGEKGNLFRFMNIRIPHQLNTYIGTNYAPTGTVPAGVDADKVTKSMQKWYAEYYLPSEIHAAPKGGDVYDYGRRNAGLDYKESFWLQNGYIVVNFDIQTVQNNKPHLSYINAENAQYGYCNMWNKEGYQYEKTDYKGNKFGFEDGDYVLYYTNKSAGRDYISGGTH